VVQEFGKIIIIFGIMLILVGGTLWFFGKIPFLGKLPGDILIKRENFTFYAPIATSILISIILTILLTIISNIRR